MCSLDLFLVSLRGVNNTACPEASICEVSMWPWLKHGQSLLAFCVTDPLNVGYRSSYKMIMAQACGGLVVAYFLFIVVTSHFTVASRNPIRALYVKAHSTGIGLSVKLK